MADDELLREVARTMAAQQRAEAEHERSTHAQQALAPLDLRTRERLVDAIMSQLADDAPALANRRFARRALILVGGLSAAAALLMLAGPRSSPLPGYESSSSGGERSVRSQDSQPSAALRPRLGPTSRFEWVLRPDRPAEGQLALQTFYLDAGLHPWQISAEISAQGSVRIAGLGAELGLPQGEVTLVAVIARANELPSRPELTAAELKAPPPAWRVLELEVELVP